jgi:ATP-dependent Clp protease ATP-binding subunit ClpA
VRAKRDAEIAQVRWKYQRQIARIERQLRQEEREIEQDQADLDARRREETIGIAESAFNFLTGRRPTYAVTWAARRRRWTQRAESDVQESEDAIADLQAMGEQLQSALDEEIAEINERWAGIFESAQTLQLQARKSDISVDVFGLAWVPFWHVAGQVNGAAQQLRLRAYDVN